MKALKEEQQQKLPRIFVSIAAYRDPELQYTIKEMFEHATYPERIVVAAAFHPGRLVTDGEDSPHLLLAKIKARVYIGRASEDPSFSDEHKAAVEDVLSKAAVDYTLEQSPAKHGWVPSDTPVYDSKESEKHWKTLVPLLDSKLKEG